MGHPLNRALRRVHRSVLATLAVCAGVIAVGGASEDPAVPADPAPGFAWGAGGLGVVSILTRRRRAGDSPGRVRRHVGLSLVSLVAAAAVGLVGVAAAHAGVPRATALLYALAGALFALRPPLPVTVKPAGPT